MKFSYNWLQELSGANVTPQRMAEVLTLHSFEARVAEKKKQDTILEIDILPNRAHEGFSHMSVARELAVVLNSRVRAPAQKVKEAKHLKTSDFIHIKVGNANACPRYGARFIEGVKVGPSPAWLKKRLETLGLNSINTVVDATNYVMLEMGQPLHAFDASKIAKEDNRHTIFVRASKPKEVIMTLDGQKRELPQGTLLIADAHKPLAIAGIKGGAGSEISSGTTSIIIEAANFNSDIVRKGSKALGISTDASVRFSQNISPELVASALDRAAVIIQKVAGGLVYQGIAEYYPRKLVPRHIVFDNEYAERLSGISIAEPEVKKIFERLGFSVSKINPFASLGYVIKEAHALLGATYKFGASTTFDAPKAFDCSSLIRHLYRIIGIDVPPIPFHVKAPRTLYQADMGKKVDLKNLKAGDLIFTKGRDPHVTKKYPAGIGHVALYVGDKKVIHASSAKGKVALEPLTVFLKNDPFRIAKRIVDKEMDKDYMLVSVPTTRLDIELAEDLIEEVVRIKGYNAIKAQLPTHELMAPEIHEAFGWHDMFKKILASVGFDEVHNIVFVSNEELETLSFKEKGNYIELANPLSTHYTHMRPTLFIPLLKNVRDNGRFFEAFKLFELGKIYQRGIGTSPFEHERASCAGIFAYKRNGSEKGFFEIKGLLDAFFEKLGLTDVWYDDYKPHVSHAIWQHASCAEIKAGNKSLGFVGALKPEILSRFDIEHSVYAFELNVGTLLSLAREDRRYEDIPKYPAIERDISILAPLDIRMVDVLNIIEPLGGMLLENTDLIDSYEGNEMPEGKQSLTFRLVFRSKDKTLSDEEVHKIMGKISNAIKRKNWEVR